MRYLQDGLTPAEHIQLGLDLGAQVPDDEWLGEPLDEDDEDGDFGPQLRGYLDVAESILQRPPAQNVRVSEQRFVSLMSRCRNNDPSQRPEIEEIMLQAAQGMAEAGVFVPAPPTQE